MAASDPIGLINDKLLSEFLSAQTSGKDFAGMKRIDEYYRGIQDLPFKPHDASRAYRSLMERSQLNLLDLVVNTRAQGLLAEGYRSDDPDASNAKAWDYWTNSRWDSRQSQVWRTALTYGVAYATAVMGKNQFTGAMSPVLTAYSPLRSMAFYDDMANDEWPEYFIIVKGLRGRSRVDWNSPSKVSITFMDDELIIQYVQGDEENVWREVSRTPHGAGVCPVVRFVSDLDLDGRYTGEVEPLMKAQDSLNQTLFDLMMTQTFNSFKVRWVSGVMVGEVDEDGNPCSPEQASANKLRMAQDTFLAFPDADTKVGALPETALGPFIDSSVFSIRKFAIKSQTPPQNFLGDIGGNIASDALSALEASSSKKTRNFQRVFGESIGQLLRLASKLDGNVTDATNYALQVNWIDPETRSLAQIADAWGKIAVMLKVPVEQTWEHIPNIDLDTVKRWKEAKKIQDAKDRALLMAGGGNGTNPSSGPRAATASSGVVQPTAGQLGSASGSTGGATASGSTSG